MSQFATSKRLCCWAGLTPGSNESTGKKKYESLVKRRGKKRAIIAIARMLLTAIFQMLTTGEVWNPCDLYKIDMPEALLEKQKQKAIKQAQKLLIREGLLPPPETIAS